ncbi:TPA: FeoA domain-containing protein, partial [Campylobacter jejuni]|nr:FeoA domain-containing protein [Campylobacter jejuni]
MTLDNLKDGQKAIIVNLSAQKELKNRLLSFGFIKNKNLKKIHSSLKNATIMVELD